MLKIEQMVAARHNLSFKKAVSYMKQGYMVRRGSWDTFRVGIRYDSDRNIYIMKRVIPFKVVEPWRPKAEDRSARDWCVPTQKYAFPDYSPELIPWKEGLRRYEEMQSRVRIGHFGETDSSPYKAQNDAEE